MTGSVSVLDICRLVLPTHSRLTRWCYSRVVQLTVMVALKLQKLLWDCTSDERKCLCIEQ